MDLGMALSWTGARASRPVNPRRCESDDSDIEAVEALRPWF